ncbi:unnamed protein product, partial [Iphiclides podalirius]
MLLKTKPEVGRGHGRAAGEGPGGGRLRVRKGSLVPFNVGSPCAGILAHFDGQFAQGKCEIGKSQSRADRVAFPRDGPLPLY